MQKYMTLNTDQKDTIMKREPVESRENGFTLIEVMITIFLISVGIFAIMKLQMASIQGNGNAMRMSESTLVLSDEVESILSDSITNFAATGPTDEPVTFTAGDHGQYTISYTVQDIPVAETASSYKQISINTSWDYQGKTHTMTNTIIKLDTET
jgi:prepilin-type N-terminal cleavage/methylation domain-containing protein